MKTNGHLALPTLPPLAPPKPLRDALADLHRRFGQRAIMRLDGPPLPCSAIPTGFPALDSALGVGGVPRGRITDIYGPESSGKTALCLSIIAEAQRAGGWAFFIDADHALDPGWATRWGVNIHQLGYATPENGEQALEIADTVIRAGATVVVVDSTASLAPREEISGGMGDEWRIYGSLMSQAMRKLAGPVGKSGTALIFTSQLRANDRSEAKVPGPTGGYALRFYASIRIDLRPVEFIRPDTEYIGVRVRATIKKSKVASPLRHTEINLLWAGQDSSSTSSGKKKPRG